MLSLGMFSLRFSVSCLPWIDVLTSLLSGRLVRERIDPAMLSAVQSQMGAVETTYEEAQSIFDTGAAKGLSIDTLERIPTCAITRDDNLDSSEEKVSCPVCLQVKQYGVYLIVSTCSIWLVRHSSCPLCRRDL